MSRATITDVQRRLLQYIVRNQDQPFGKRPGWCRCVTLVPRVWDWPDYQALADLGLIEYVREYMDNWARVTEAGWALLADEPKETTT